MWLPKRCSRAEHLDSWICLYLSTQTSTKDKKHVLFFCTIVDCFRLLSTCFEGLQTVTYYLCIEIILILSLVEMCMTMVLFCVHALMWHFKWLTFLSFQSSKKSFFVSRTVTRTVLCTTQDSLFVFFFRKAVSLTIILYTL